ncbi:hypothetical protein RB195_001547 [Necator americanus]|uniref:Uncharacterized protein n=1 Tax=Necator americanus TaxID=51031 RepID=A0ABR1DEU1_NECAM
MRRIDDRWTKRRPEWIPRDAKHPRVRPPTKWGDMFAARIDQLRAQLDTAQGPRQRARLTQLFTSSDDLSVDKLFFGFQRWKSEPYLGDELQSHF